MATALERPTVSEEGVPAVSRPICFVSWGAVAGRSREIAEAIGGEARCFFPPGASRRPPVLVRYLLSAIGTVVYLLRRRPRVVVVTNPPILAALVAYGCARVLGASVVLDSHPGGFGVQGDRVAARLQRLHRWMVRRAAMVLVTDQTWTTRVESWGGTATVLHEAPAGWDCPAPARHPRLRVLVVGRFGGDEPVADVVAAATALSECDFALTGDRAGCPPAVRDAAPPNVAFVGFLDPAGYRDAVADCDVVLTLTTEPTSVMRAAYEAVYARRPVIVSDWPIGRSLFPYARHTANDHRALERAVRAVSADYRRFAGSVEDARRLQLERWETQRGVLVEAIGRMRP